MSTGLTCTLLIFLWVQDELSTDKFHENDAHLYQLMRKLHTPTGISVGDWVPGPLAESIREALPEVTSITCYKTHITYEGNVRVNDEHLKAIPMYADRYYLQLFNFPLLHGDKTKVLSDKYAAVISEDLAIKLFKTTEVAMGKVIQWEQKAGDNYDMTKQLTVTGVFENLPANSTEQFDVLMNLDFYIEHNPGMMLWSNDQGTTALALRPGTALPVLEEKINRLCNENTDWERQFMLQRYSSKYLHGNYENGVPSGGRITYVWGFSGVAILILIIASINFMNLATAKASIRVKEIGVKKTLGAARQSLIYQFVLESLVMSSLALLAALLLVFLLLPFFNEITNKQISLRLDLSLIASFLGISMITGLLSSTYPALYLSGFKPIEVLKGKLNLSFGELWTRNGLVVFQFAISFLLIVSILVVYQQMNYVTTKNLGLDREHILSIKQQGMSNDRVDVFLSEVRQLPTVVQAANSNYTLFGAENRTGGIDWEGRPENLPMIINPIITNYYFIETFGIQIKEGRSFSPEFGADSLKVILNETAVKKMGLENPIGQTLRFWGDDVEIVGIARDFHTHSFYKPVEPCIIKKFGSQDNYGNHIWIKIRAGQEKEAISAIEQLYADFNPGYVFDYGFADEDYQALYQSENRVSTLLKYFAILAIVISCLGLLGLTAFIVERRTKEIGIRKILGANSWSVVSLFSKGFIKIVLTGILIATPISYLIAAKWLDGFAYRIDLHWWIFPLVAGITLLIAWLTVGFQTLKAANINPVESLKAE